MRILTFLLLACAAAAVSARGLDFSEEMHGYAYWNGEFRDASFYLDVDIADIDAWRASATHPARVAGHVVFDGATVRSLSGTLEIMAQAPGGAGRLLVYRLGGYGFRYVGAKLVRDDRGFDVVDDTTRLRGVFRLPTQALPDPYSLWVDASWTSEVFFEWWRVGVVWDFFASFRVTNAWWWEYPEVHVIFLQTFFGGLADEFFPWIF
jgi:hypothetical protein